MIDGPLFSIGNLSFHPYGLCMALGIIFCFTFLLYTFKWCNFNEEAIDKILIIGIFATAFGVFMAMVFQALYDFIESPSQGFSLGGSMTFQGGLIGGVASFLAVWNLYIFVIAPRTKHKALQNNMNASLSDALPVIPIGITIAHAFGRLGCTFAGCCHGARTDKWFGVWMHTVEFGYAKVVPTQSYECLFLVILTGIMALLLFKWKFKYNLSVYAIAYGIWRFLIEYVRDDYRGSFVGGITPSQFWSIIMVVLGIAYVFIAKYWLVRFEKHPQSQPRLYEKKVKKAALGGAAADGAADGASSEAAEKIADSLKKDDSVGDVGDGGSPSDDNRTDSPEKD